MSNAAARDRPDERGPAFAGRWAIDLLGWMKVTAMTAEPPAAPIDLKSESPAPPAVAMIFFSWFENMVL